MSNFEKWRQSYPISEWILSSDYVNVGDRVEFWDEGEERSFKGEIEQKLDTPYFMIRLDWDGCLHKISYYNHVTFKCKKYTDPTKCSCGAKHTSNPKYHLSYCDLNEKEYK
jgi:hypothetical protein